MFSADQVECVDYSKKDPAKSGSSWSGRRICKYAAGAVTGAVCAMMFYVGVKLRAKVIWDESFKKAKENLAAQLAAQAVSSPEPQPEPPLGSLYCAAKGMLDSKVEVMNASERALEAEQAKFKKFGFWKKLSLVFRGLQVTGSAQERVWHSGEQARVRADDLKQQDKVLVKEQAQLRAQLQAATEIFIQTSGKPPAR